MTEQKEFNIEDELPRIAVAFNGMDNEYVKLVRGHHDFYLDKTRTDAAKSQNRAQTSNAIVDLVTGRIVKALAAIEEIRTAYNPAPTPVRKSDAGRLADLTLWANTLPTATVDELADLHATHAGDPDFTAIFEAELRRREGAGEDGLAVGMLRHTIATKTAPVALPALDSLEKTFKAIRSTCRDMYPAGLKMAVVSGMRDSPKYRTVHYDLDAFPVSDGPTYRPVFSLPGSEE